MRTLHQTLMDAGRTRLNTICRFWDAESADSSKLAIVRALTARMSNKKAVAEALAATPGDQKAALQNLLDSGGVMPSRAFARRWGETRVMGPGRMERLRPWLAPVSPAEGLWYTGLIAQDFEEGPQGPYEVVFVPAELRNHLLVFSPAETSSDYAIPRTRDPETVREAGEAFLNDACTFLAYLQDEDVQVRSGGRMAESHWRCLSSRLLDGDRRRFAFLRRVLAAVGMTRRADGGRLGLAGATVLKWLKSETMMQSTTLARAWESDSDWNDLFYVTSLIPEQTTTWRNEPTVARRAVISHLGMCEVGVWYRFDDFVGFIKTVDPDFQRPDGDYDSWYIRDASTGTYLSGYQSWDAVEGAVIRHLISGPMAWLGLAAVGGPGCSGAPSAFRLTRTGGAFLGRSQDSVVVKTVGLSVRPDFAVEVPSESRYDRFQLSRVAEWVHSGDSFVYRLTPASLGKARRSGIPLDRVLDFLVSASGEPVPKAVEASLTRWEAQGTEVHLEQVVLLRFADEDLALEFQRSCIGRELDLEQIERKLFAVHPRDLDRVVVALGEMGLLAEVVEIDNRD
jgi:hypothetical protein